MLRATYYGKEYPDVYGKTGIIRKHKGGLAREGKEMLIQFDDTELSSVWTHAWWDVHAHDLILVSAEHEDNTRRAMHPLEDEWPYTKAYEVVWKCIWLYRYLRARRKLKIQLQVSILDRRYQDALKGCGPDLI